MRRVFWWLFVELFEPRDGYFRIWCGPKTASLHPVSCNHLLRKLWAELLTKKFDAMEEESTMPYKTTFDCAQEMAIYDGHAWKSRHVPGTKAMMKPQDMRPVTGGNSLQRIRQDPPATPYKIVDLLLQLESAAVGVSLDIRVRLGRSRSYMNSLHALLCSQQRYLAS